MENDRNLKKSKISKPKSLAVSQRDSVANNKIVGKADRT